MDALLNKWKWNIKQNPSQYACPNHKGENWCNHFRNKGKYCLYIPCFLFFFLLHSRKESFDFCTNDHLYLISILNDTFDTRNGFYVFFVTQSTVFYFHAQSCHTMGQRNDIFVTTHCFFQLFCFLFKLHFTLTCTYMFTIP